MATTSAGVKELYTGRKTMPGKNRGGKKKKKMSRGGKKKRG